MGVGDQEGAEDGVHDGVERTGGEGSNGERDQTHADSPDRDVSICRAPSIHTFVIAWRTSRKSSGSYPRRGEAWGPQPGRSLSGPSVRNITRPVSSLISTDLAEPFRFDSKFSYIGDRSEFDAQQAE